MVRCPVFAKTDHQLTNKVRGQKIVRPLFEVDMSPRISNELAAPFTPVKSTVGSKSDTPLKTLLLSNTPYHSNSVEKNKLINSLLDLIVEVNLPISIVDHPALVKYTSHLNNRFRIPCRQTYTNTIIPQKSKDRKEVLKTILGGIEHCSLTCDGWTSVGHNSYLGVTVHFAVEWELKSYILALKHVQKSHTAENLLTEIKELMTKWEINHKVVTVSADGAYNIKKAIQTSTELEYVNCLAHLLNLVVKVLFEAEDVMPLITKCRKLVGTFKHSTTLSEQLTNTIRTLHSKAKPLYVDEDQEVGLDLETLEELETLIDSDKSGKSLRTKLVQDLVTRWNSTLAMLISISESHSAIRLVITSDPERRAKYQHELLTDLELVIIEDLIVLLDPFLEMTKLVSGSKYVTISVVLPAITTLLECLALFEPTKGNEFLRDVAVKMFDNLNDRTTKHFENRLMLAATFMDPRYRNFKFIKDQSDRDIAIFRAEAYIKSVFANKFR